MKKNKKDRIIYISSIIIIVLPILLFQVCFLKLYIGIPLSVLTLYLAYRCITNYTYVSYKAQKKYWIIAAIVIFFWLFFSGIGGFSYQNSIDFHVRNAMLRDLVNYNWPVIYKNNGLVYYLSYFLPSALIGKITNYTFANVFLFLYSYICLLCTLYLINRHAKKDSYYKLLFLILFSGLDVLDSLPKLLSINHLEWWNLPFQYSSNTTALYWVFNQTIPIWLIIAILLNIDDGRDIIFLSSISFFYSPYSTISIIPIALYLSLKKIKRKRTVFLSLQTLYACFIAIILGLYYMSGTGTEISGFVFNVYKEYSKPISLIIKYIFFIIIEVVIFIIPTWKHFKHDKLYLIVVFELLLIPLYVISENNDFCMRSSLPCLFILMLYFCKYIEQIEKKRNKKYLFLYILLALSFVNPLHEISRSIAITLTTDNYIADDIVSIGEPQEYKNLCAKQFYGNLNSIYFKYLSK